MGRIRIGLSGWSYDDWRGDFYPEDLAPGDELRFASREFDTIEVNATFYRLTSPDTCRRWRDETPSDFRFAIKGSRFITHNKRLKDTRQALANFLASGLLELGDKLGPILWQLPADLEFDSVVLETYLAMLPPDTQSAVDLASEHDDRVPDASYGNGDNQRMRHVVEVRHESFLSPETARIAGRRGAALCFSHSTGWPYIEEITAGFVYLRLHGPEAVYQSPYSDDSLEEWARRIRMWHLGDEPEDASRISGSKTAPRTERDVYVYFNNDMGGHAPRDAMRLREMIEPH